MDSPAVTAALALMGVFAVSCLVIAGVLVLKQDVDAANSRSIAAIASQFFMGSR